MCYALNTLFSTRLQKQAFERIKKCYRSPSSESWQNSCVYRYFDQKQSCLKILVKASRSYCVWLKRRKRMPDRKQYYHPWADQKLQGGRSHSFGREYCSKSYTTLLESLHHHTKRSCGGVFDKRIVRLRMYECEWRWSRISRMISVMCLH